MNAYGSRLLSLAVALANIKIIQDQGLVDHVHDPKGVAASPTSSPVSTPHRIPAPRKSE